MGAPAIEPHLPQPVESSLSATGQPTELAVTGMSCGNCARHVGEALQSVPGVASARVTLEKNQASVRWAPSAPQNETALLHALAEAGYGGEIIQPLDAHGHDHAEHRSGAWKLNLIIGLAGMIPLMLGEWIFHWEAQNWFRWVSFVIATIVQVFAGAGFYRGAWNQFKARSSSMDTLVALGSTTAYAYSVWALFTGASTHLYFMEAASIITLISVGHWMEARMGTKASAALKDLLQLAPAKARLRNADGTLSEVAASELRIGDAVLLKPGDQVPTDGIVLDGGSSVDESMLTGESAPVDKDAGALLFGGTTNLDGQLTMKVTATGESTALSQVIAAVEKAQSSRANIQRLGDKVSNVFVPIVVVVAVAAGLWWGLAPGSARAVHDWLSQYLWQVHLHPGLWAAALIIPASVLIIACPCAMGLATPTAIMAGSNAAARRGILIRDGVALEKAGEVTAVLFDKTGTLTMGKPAVAEVKVLSTAYASEEITRLAAGLARPSNHPLSKAIAAVQPEGGNFFDWQEFRGSGVQGNHTVNGGKQLLRLGSLRWLGESQVDLRTGHDFVETWTKQGATVLGLATEKELLAVIALRDTIKPGSKEVVAKLKRQGLRVYLVTGDNARTASMVAEQAGIDSANIRAEVRPEQKAAIVQELQSRGERVAFVGDGINDAPALEQADLGIAVSKASDIARAAADIILLNSEIEAVPESLGLARATLRTIKQNLFWAFFYNAVGIPLAALGFMSPVLCAAAMGFSDVIVIGNALRLRKWKLR
ncbi:MAG: Cu+-exporting ATPase [Verrucomicrobiales bacterium]|nr:Cu+-exporting ATPase [Verrucomicrobiales bacterium]